MLCNFVSYPSITKAYSFQVISPLDSFFSPTTTASSKAFSTSLIVSILLIPPNQERATPPGTPIPRGFLLIFLHTLLCFYCIYTLLHYYFTKLLHVVNYKLY